MYLIIMPLALALVIAILFGKVLIPFLKSKKMGQKILEIGPRWHRSKEGTPYLGGLLFISGTLAGFIAFIFIADRKDGNYADLYTLIMALCYALIGFADDYTKRLKKMNEGLTAAQKLALEFPVAIIYAVVMEYSGVIDTKLFIPFANINIEFGFFYYIFLVLGIVFIVNSVNIHDGIDGLCGTTTAIIAIMFIVLFYIGGNHPGIILTSAFLGGIIGFLYYNMYPARIFMGDTGSSFLGGMVAGIAVWMKIPLLLVLFGIVYIIESVSDIIQVGSYKLRGKRVFKMAPIHHHFELCGWSEWKIVLVSASVTLVMSAISAISVIIK